MLVTEQEHLLLANRNALHVDLGSNEHADAMVSIVEGSFSDSVCQICVSLSEQALSVVSDLFFSPVSLSMCKLVKKQ